MLLYFEIWKYTFVLWKWTCVLWMYTFSFWEVYFCTLNVYFFTLKVYFCTLKVCCCKLKVCSLYFEIWKYTFVLWKYSFVLWMCIFFLKVYFCTWKYAVVHWKYDFVLYTFIRWKCTFVLWKQFFSPQCMFASGCIENQYSKGKEKVVIHVHLKSATSLLLVIPPTLISQGSYHEILSLENYFVRCILESYSHELVMSFVSRIISMLFSNKNARCFSPKSCYKGSPIKQYVLCFLSSTCYEMFISRCFFQGSWYVSLDWAISHEMFLPRILLWFLSLKNIPLVLCVLSQVLCFETFLSCCAIC